MKPLMKQPKDSRPIEPLATLALARRYSPAALARRDVCPARFHKWLRRYTWECIWSGIVAGHRGGIPVLDRTHADAPWFKQRCAMLGLDCYTGDIVGPEGRTNKPRTVSPLYMVPA